MNKKKTILIVDDDMDYLFQLRLRVEQMGFNTITAESQAEVEKIIMELKPDLCILDLMMESDDSGFVLCYKIKRKYPDVPIIIATGVTAETGMTFEIHADDENSWINADLFLDKGIRTEELQREIKRLLKI